MDSINLLDRLFDVLSTVVAALVIGVGGGFMWVVKKVNASTTKKELEDVKRDILMEQTKLKEYIFETMAYKINLLIEPIQVNLEFIKESLNEIKQSIKNHRDTTSL